MHQIFKSFILKGLTALLFCPFFCYSKKIFPPLTFRESKKILIDLYQEHPYTFYCECQFDKNGNVVYLSELIPQNTPADLTKLEWEHVVPASMLGRQLSCWNKNTCPVNAKSNRQCCRKTSKEFNQMEANLYNLVPAIKLSNRARSNYKPGVIHDKSMARKVCHLYLDTKRRIIEPSDKIKGFFARTYLKMDKLYSISLSDRDRLLFLQWDMIYPKETWEVRREQLIDEIYGITDN